MPQPLREVFGFPHDDFREEAVYSRLKKLCPYNNITATCTKDRKGDPLGVCTMLDDGTPIIICPVRFRESWRIINDAAPFLLPDSKNITYVSEPILRDAEKNTVGKIDLVLVEHDNGDVINFAPLEIQSVYISGNIRNPFNHYMADPSARFDEDWTGPNYPVPDWLSSVKRLIHQLTAKGMIIVNAWGKRFGIAAQHQFFNSFPLFKSIPEVPEEKANCAWFLYDLIWDPQKHIYALKLERKIYFSFDDFLNTFSATVAGDMQDFTDILQRKLAKKLKNK